MIISQLWWGELCVGETRLDVFIKARQMGTSRAGAIAQDGNFDNGIWV